MWHCLRFWYCSFAVAVERDLLPYAVHFISWNEDAGGSWFCLSITMLSAIRARAVYCCIALARLPWTSCRKHTWAILAMIQRSSALRYQLQNHGSNTEKSCFFSPNVNLHAARALAARNAIGYTYNTSGFVCVHLRMWMLAMLIKERTLSCECKVINVSFQGPRKDLLSTITRPKTGLRPF